jgi:hypothetical protein
MNRFDVRLEQPRHAVAPPSAGRAMRTESHDRSRAVIVMGLTLACTALALLDLLLLAASG